MSDVQRRSPSTHPLNSLLRFSLELAALAALGYWGYQLEHEVLRWVTTLGLPLGAAVFWGVFAVPGDPSRSGRTVVNTPGWLRLLLELALFASATAALNDRDVPIAAATLGGLTLLHYVISYDRIAWLFRH